MKYFVLLSVALTFVACENKFGGNLSLNESISFAQKKGKVVNLPAGFHQAKIEGKKKSITLKVNSEKIKIKVEKSARDKMRQDEFTLLPSETGQSFIIAGLKDTKIDIGQKQRDKEFCSYTVKEHKCVVKVVKVKDEQGKVKKKKVKKCGKFPVTKKGVRKVAYHIESTTNYLELELIDAQDGITVLGSFDGSNYSSDKVYDHRGKCHKR